MKSSQGFTLIELMVVMAIIALLAAIAIPQFNAYRIRSFNALALNDLRNMVTAQEALYSSEEIYEACENAACLAIPGFQLSGDVDISVELVEADAFEATSSHPKGDLEYSFSSATGTYTSAAPGGGNGGFQ